MKQKDDRNMKHPFISVSSFLFIVSSAVCKTQKLFFRDLRLAYKRSTSENTEYCSSERHIFLMTVKGKTMHISYLPQSGTSSQDSQESADLIIDLRQVAKTYKGSAGVFVALKEINFQVLPGEFVAVVGKSGSGKSTLLNLLTGIDMPTSGEVVVAGTPLHRLSQNALALWRGCTVGMVFQFYQLLPTLTVLENVMLPMDFCHTFPIRERKERALHLLEQVGIAQHAQKLPVALSGGEQQRVAIARAQANNPSILVADEPTGNLDSQTTDAILHLFLNLVNDGTTLIMVTHERDISHHATRTISLSDGRIVNSTQPPVSEKGSLQKGAAHE
jgi:putative ABC transport system ATP-binding protein